MENNLSVKRGVFNTPTHHHILTQHSLVHEHLGLSKIAFGTLSVWRCCVSCMCQVEPLTSAHQALEKRLNQRCLLVWWRLVSKNQCQKNEICAEDSAILRIGLLRASFGGCHSSNPSWARYLPSRTKSARGPYAGVDHEEKTVQRLKHRAGNSSNVIIVLPLI